MLKRKNLLISLALLLFVFSISAVGVKAKSDEGETIAKHLKSKYKAKKVKIPFMWLAKFAVKVVRPAGVKSFNVTLYQDLQFSKETVDLEMQKIMRNSLGADWSPIIHVRSREGQQVYMYLKEDGKNVRMMLVTIENNQAALIKAKFNPDKLAEFINDPKIFGIKLNDDKGETDEPKSEKPDEKTETESS